MNFNLKMNRKSVLNLISVLQLIISALVHKAQSDPANNNSSEQFHLTPHNLTQQQFQLDYAYYYDYGNNNDYYGTEDFPEDISPSTPSMNQKEECREFCYSTANKCCGFSSGLWGSTCRSGKQQSPIALPNCADGKSFSQKSFYLDPDLYKGKFNLENDGHAVVLHFQDNNKTVDFGGNGRTLYTFHTLKFHWGKEDNAGSEHCFKRSSSMKGGDKKGEKCPRESMELQLIHYKSSFKDYRTALNSGHSGAIVIVSILLRVSNASLDSPTIVPVLNPVVKHLEQIQEAGMSVSVKSTFDLTPWLNSPNFAATYPGSVTTPSCKQVVKWFVLQEPFAVRSQDVQAFRSVMQANGKPLLGNRRPLQKKGKRNVNCLWVKLKYSGE